MSAALPTSETIAMRLSNAQTVARDTKMFTFERLDGGILPPAEAGAHIGLLLPNGVERQYSLLTPGEAPKSYVIAAKREGGGRGGSLYLHDHLGIGDELLVQPPRNNFALAAEASHSVLIAGGIGVTPIWCMAQSLTAQRQSFEIHYAAQNRDGAAFLDDIQATGKAKFHSDAEAGGRVLDIAGIVRDAPAGSHFYCCGPAPMLAAFEAATAGLPPAQVHLEYFNQRYQAAQDGGYKVVLAKSDRSFAIPPGKTILHVLHEAGITVASSCEEGVCGACETRVISGEPDHRDAILSPKERAENKTMFICCSGCKGTELVLDL